MATTVNFSFWFKQFEKIVKFFLVTFLKVVITVANIIVTTVIINEIGSKKWNQN